MAIGRANSRRWADKLEARDHRVAWEVVVMHVIERWRGTCRRCGGVIVCGAGPAVCPEGPDMRRMRRCAVQRRGYSRSSRQRG
jgi:hypothetical protein